MKWTDRILLVGYVIFTIVYVGNLHWRLAAAQHEIKQQLAARYGHNIMFGDIDVRADAVRRCASDDSLERDALDFIRSFYAARRTSPTDGARTDGPNVWRVKQLVDEEHWTMRDYYRTKILLGVWRAADPHPSKFE